MLKIFQGVKEDLKRYHQLRSVHNRVSAVWLSLKRYYEQSGCNYGTYALGDNLGCKNYTNLCKINK